MIFLLIALGILVLGIWAAWLDNEVFCPVCGYYCTGKGGAFCIDKPGLHNFSINE